MNQEKIKHQEDFIKAIGFQYEVALNSADEAIRYRDYLAERLNTEQNHLKQLKEQNV